MDIFSLPDEILLKICEEMDIPSLLNASEASSRIYKISEEHRETIKLFSIMKRSNILKFYKTIDFSNEKFLIILLIQRNYYGITIFRYIHNPYLENIERFNLPPLLSIWEFSVDKYQYKFCHNETVNLEFLDKTYFYEDYHVPDTDKNRLIINRLIKDYTPMHGKTIDYPIKMVFNPELYK